MRRRMMIWVAVLATVGLSVACSRLHSDEAIATSVKAKMFSDPQLKPADVSVAVKDGVVTLSGEVPSDAARYAAYKDASETPGVSKVNDQMTVGVAQAAAPPVESQPAPPAAVSPKARVVKHPASAPAGRTESITATAAPTSAPAAPVAPPPPQPRVVEIPSGTTITVRTIDTIDSSIDHSGETFRSSLDAPIVVDNEVVVPAGVDVFLRLVDARSAGRMTGRSEIALQLERFEFQGKSYPLVTSEYRQAGSSRGKRTAATVGGGAALGALIGAVAGGGKGAAIGAAVGAAGGTGVQAATKGQQIKIPSETRLDFRLEQPVEVKYFPGQNRRARRTTEPAN